MILLPPVNPEIRKKSGGGRKGAPLGLTLGEAPDHTSRRFGILTRRFGMSEPESSIARLVGKRKRDGSPLDKEVSSGLS